MHQAKIAKTEPVLLQILRELRVSVLIKFDSRLNFAALTLYDLTLNLSRIFRSDLRR